MLHERTFSTIGIEYHETLQNNSRDVFNSHFILPPGVETHRDNFDSMTSKIIRAFSHEYYDVTQDVESSTKLTNHILNDTTHFLPEISEAS